MAICYSSPNEDVEGPVLCLVLSSFYRNSLESLSQSHALHYHVFISIPSFFTGVGCISIRYVSYAFIHLSSCLKLYILSAYYKSGTLLGIEGYSAKQKQMCSLSGGIPQASKSHHTQT